MVQDAFGTIPTCAMQVTTRLTSKFQIYWLLPPFVLFTTAFGGTVVPRLNLVLSLICREYFCERSIQDPTFHMMPVMLGSDNPQCQIPEVQALVSKFTLYQSLLSGIISAVTSPKLGELSDRYGRKRLICISALGLLINEIISICVYTYPDMLSVKWILLGSVFDGLGGSFIAAMALSYAFASDCIIPERRNVVFGWYQGSLFGGFALGPILAGYVVKATGKLLSVFYIAIALHGAFFLFILLIVPESLSKERQMAAREKRRVKDKDSVGDFREHSSSNWLTYLIRIIKSSNLVAPLAILWPTEPGTNPDVRRNLALLAAVDGTMFGIAMGSLTVILLYSEYMFGWNTFESSVFVSIVNVCRVTTLLVLLPIITRIVRGPASRRTKQTSGSDKIDLRIIRTAITFDLLGYIGYASFRTGPLFIMCGAIAAVGGMGSPILQASLTKHVPSDRTGQVLGAMGLLHAAGRVVSPIIFNLIYASTVGKFTQTVFVCLAATFGLAFLFSWFIKPNGKFGIPCQCVSCC